MSEFSVVPLASLQLDPNNARLHPDDSIDALCKSLDQFGQPEPLVVQASRHRVIAGNGRLTAMRKLGWSECAIRLVDWDDRKAQAYALAANRTAELSSWDVDRLASQLSDLRVDFDMDAIGFDPASMDDLRALVALKFADAVLDTDALEEPDIPEAPANPISRPGDIWLLGDNRLMCGDSTNEKDVQALMDDQLAQLVFTSPPYDQQRDYGRKVTDWQKLMRGVFERLPVEDSAQVCVNLGLVHKNNEWHPYWEPWIAWMRQRGWRRFGWYVWDQGSGLPGDWNGRFAPSHEFIFHFNRVAERARKTKVSKTGGKIAKGDGLRRKDGIMVQRTNHGKPQHMTKIPDSVVRITRHTGSCGGHPAPFAVKLVAEIYAALSDAGDVCYEPFAGSGTCALAAQQIDRRCYAMEIEPAYCDIAVQRWEKLTGKVAERNAKAA